MSFFQEYISTLYLFGDNQIICYGDPLEIEHSKDENSRLGFIESAHER